MIIGILRSLVNEIVDPSCVHAIVVELLEGRHYTIDKIDKICC